MNKTKRPKPSDDFAYYTLSTKFKVRTKQQASELKRDMLILYNSKVAKWCGNKTNEKQ